MNGFTRRRRRFWVHTWISSPLVCRNFILCSIYTGHLLTVSFILCNNLLHHYTILVRLDSTLPYTLYMKTKNSVTSPFVDTHKTFLWIKMSHISEKKVHHMCCQCLTVSSFYTSVSFTSLSSFRPQLEDKQQGWYHCFTSAVCVKKPWSSQTDLKHSGLLLMCVREGSQSSTSS